MKTTPRINRRTFIKHASLTAAGVWLTGCATSSPRSALSRPRLVTANEKFRVGCVGIGGQGGAVTTELAGFPDVEIAALCDVDAKYAANTIKKYPGAPVYKDYREMLDKERNLHAVMIGTPDHWHAP